LREAAAIAYQAFFFDNSGNAPELIAHFKQVADQLKWDANLKGEKCKWFKNHYLDKKK